MRATWPEALFIQACKESHLVRVSLVDQEPLTLPGVAHLDGVLRNQRVEECVERLAREFLSPEDASETLRFLATGATVSGNLDEDVRFRQVEGSVSDLKLI